MNRIANEEGMHPRVLLEVNVAGEGSKFGFKPETVRAEMESCSHCRDCRSRDSCAFRRSPKEAEASRNFFAVARLRDALEKEFDLKLPQLSMGMTNDFRSRSRRARRSCGWARPFLVSARRNRNRKPQMNTDFHGFLNPGTKTFLFIRVSSVSIRG